MPPISYPAVIFKLHHVVKSSAAVWSRLVIATGNHAITETASYGQDALWYRCMLVRNERNQHTFE